MPLLRSTGPEFPHLSFRQLINHFILDIVDTLLYNRIEQCCVAHIIQSFQQCRTIMLTTWKNVGSKTLFKLEHIEYVTLVSAVTY
jgi:hypothetical protein